MTCFRTNAQLQLNYHCQTLTYHIHRRGTKMDNPEKLATHGTQDDEKTNQTEFLYGNRNGRRQHKQIS